MYLDQTLDIQIRDSIFDPSGTSTDAVKKIARKLESGGKTHYKVWIYASGNDLPYVDYIEYILHPTFRERVHKIKRSPSNPNCQFIIWTWGLFEVQARVVDKLGKQFKIVHALSYDDQFEDAKVFLTGRP